MPVPVPVSTKSYKPSDEERKQLEAVTARVVELKEFRKNPLPGSHRSIEDIWRDADVEFTPHELSLGASRKRFETDQDTGLRSRLVKVGDSDDWQSSVSSADFYVKVSTAVSILIDMNPEAVFTPASRRYEASTKLMYRLWKQSWERSLARTQMKKFTFNLAKYGFAVAKTYPREVRQQKKLWGANKGSKDLVKYSDLCRQSLNPWSVWVSPMAQIGDPLSVNDWYHEVEYDEDTFRQEFPEAEYPNARYVKPGMVSTERPEGLSDNDAQGRITVGFYENQVRDEYMIFVPSSSIVLHTSPLPNDDGMLSLWYAPWTLRDDRCIYGIGIYEIIRNDKMMYDRLSNMTLDQLTLSIYKMFFYRGVDVLGENGELTVVPGKGNQVLDPQSVTWMSVPGPGVEAWKGMEWQKSLIDDNSGVPLQLSGKFAGKTLGQDLQAKETALERMKAPLDFMCEALQQEAYLSLSWMKQMYSTPEVVRWSDREDLKRVLDELGLDATAIAAYLKEYEQPQTDGELLYQTPPETDESGEQTKPGEMYANVYREFQLPLTKDETGKLVEDEKDRFFRVGLDVPKSYLDWRGIIRIKPQSILAPSKELSKRNDLDLFNLVFPSIQAMATNPMLVPVLMPPIKQIIEVYDKNPDEWVNEKYLMKLHAEAMEPHEISPEVKVSLAVAFKDITPVMDSTQKQVMEKYLGIKVEEPLFVDKTGYRGEDKAQALDTSSMGMSNESTMTVNPKEGMSGISPVADLKPAPTTLGGAVEGATNMA